MKITMTKNTAATQLFYYAAMASLLTGVIGYIILYATAMSEGIPVFMVGAIAHIGTMFSSSIASSASPSTLIIAFLVQYRKTMLMIGLILTAVQAWLKHDAGIKLTLRNIFARPVSGAASSAKAYRTPERTEVDSLGTLKGRPVTGTAVTHTHTTVKSEDPSTLTIRMGPSGTVSDESVTHTAVPTTGKSMKHMGDL